MAVLLRKSKVLDKENIGKLKYSMTYMTLKLGKGVNQGIGQRKLWKPKRLPVSDRDHLAVYENYQKRDRLVCIKKKKKKMTSKF